VRGLTVTVLKDELWSTITALARNSKHTEVAVAYLSGKAMQLLPLRKGDTLVVDMSTKSVQDLSTNPFQVEKYLKEGVQAYTCAGLHAKVYAFDKAAIICSANVSNRSKNMLIEVGVLFEDAELVNRIHNLVQNIQKRKISPDYLEKCKRLFKLAKKRQKPTLREYRYYLRDIVPLNESRETFDKTHHISKYSEGAVYSRNENDEIDGVVVPWLKSSVEGYFPSKRRPYVSTHRHLAADNLRAGMNVYLVEHYYDRGGRRNKIRKVLNPQARARGKLVKLVELELNAGLKTTLFLD
jgi:hypothetical protein